MRIKISEISVSRVYNAVLRRLLSFPNKVKWEFSARSKQNKKKLRLYKNKYKDRRCILIANGPSLKYMDLKFLKNEISFGLNRIYLAYDNKDFTNNYLVCVNNLVLTQFCNEIDDLKIPKFVNWKNKSLFSKDDDSINYIFKSLLGAKFGKDISKSLNPSATVTYAALQIIYYMGFSEVIIIGMDHNFQTNVKNAPNKVEIRTEENDINHFDPNYFTKGVKWETPDLVSSEYFYNIAKYEFEKVGRSIIDCTINGQCKVFDKGNLKDYI